MLVNGATTGFSFEYKLNISHFLHIYIYTGSGERQLCNY
jgi:hypothetical protein